MREGIAWQLFERKPKTHPPVNEKENPSTQEQRQENIGRCGHLPHICRLYNTSLNNTSAPARRNLVDTDGLKEPQILRCTELKVRSQEYKRSKSPVYQYSKQKTTKMQQSCGVQS